jgi:predicted chitinase
MDTDHFFTTIKPLFKKFSQSQVDGINFILGEWDESGLTDLRWLAYMLATAFHETAQTMQPIREYGKGKGKKYGKKIKMSGQVYTQPDQIYYGRGYVQLTWYENYDNFGKILDIPLLEEPDLALEPSIAAKIMIIGMARGLFTGKKLSVYFNKNTDWVNARRVINGLDKAEVIAKYARIFYSGLV